MSSVTKYIAQYKIIHLNGANYNKGAVVTGLTADQETRLLSIGAIALPEEYVVPSGDGASFETPRQVFDALTMQIQGINSNMRKNDVAVKQSKLYGKFFRKLRTGQNVVIATMGDSMTYGHDTVSSDKRPAATGTLPDGSVHTQTRASITYPEALEKYLKDVYPNKVTVINRGYSGDWTKRAYERWITPAGSDITTINLGVNDSRATWMDVTAGDIDVYIEWYEKLIIREIMDYNSAVIILTPPRMKAPDMNVDTFANALYGLAKKYAVPIVDSEMFMNNYDSTFWSDGTHYNGKGYDVYGAKLAAIFLGEGGAEKPNFVSSGSRLLSRPNIDNIVYRNATFKSSSGVYTPAENLTSQGIVADVGNGGAIYYSFYTETEDIIALPIFYLAFPSGVTETGITIKAKVDLDFGVEQPDYNADYISGAVQDFTNRAAASFERTVTGTGNHFNYLNQTLLSANKLDRFHVVTKGWHTIKISFDKSTSTSATLLVHGMEFLNFRDFENSKNLINPPVQSDEVGFMRVLTHSAYAQTPAAVTETRIKAADLWKVTKLPAIGGDYYKGIPWKVTVYDYDLCITEYVFTQHSDGVGSFSQETSGNGLDFVGQIRKTDLTTSPSGYRTLTGVTYDTVTKEYVFAWGGGTSRMSSIVLQPL